LTTGTPITFYCFTLGLRYAVVEACAEQDLP